MIIQNHNLFKGSNVKLQTLFCQILKMKAAVVKAGPTVKVIDTPIPEPREGEILIKVVVAGTNPKDWKAPEVAATGAKSFAGFSLEHMGEWSNQGDDLAGYVEKVGQGVVGFKVSFTI